MNRFSNYVKETRGEMSHVNWPTRDQTIRFTSLVRPCIQLGLRYWHIAGLTCLGLLGRKLLPGLSGNMWWDL